jgi:hypothetical protein
MNTEWKWEKDKALILKYFVKNAIDKCLEKGLIQFGRRLPSLIYSDIISIYREESYFHHDRNLCEPYTDSNFCELIMEIGDQVRDLIKRQDERIKEFHFYHGYTELNDDIRIIFKNQNILFYKSICHNETLKNVYIEVVEKDEELLENISEMFAWNKGITKLMLREIEEYEIGIGRFARNLFDQMRLKTLILDVNIGKDINLLCEMLSKNRSITRLSFNYSYIRPEECDLLHKAILKKGNIRRYGFHEIREVHFAKMINLINASGIRSISYSKHEYFDDDKEMEMKEEEICGCLKKLERLNFLDEFCPIQDFLPKILLFEDCCLEKLKMHIFFGRNLDILKIIESFIKVLKVNKKIVRLFATKILNSLNISEEDMNIFLHNNMREFCDMEDKKKFGIKLRYLIDLINCNKRWNVYEHIEMGSNFKVSINTMVLCFYCNRSIYKIRIPKQILFLIISFVDRKSFLSPIY